MALGNSVFLWGSLTSGHWFCTYSLKSFWSCDVAQWTSPFWARVGSGRIRLSRTFRGPFAKLSRISRLKNAISETTVYARVAFIICVSQGATANFRTWDNTKLKPVSIDKYKHMSTSIHTDICQSIDATYSPKQGSCGNSARKLPSMNTISITYIYIYIYMFLHSGI